tara:strand:- start:1333 stop:4350 length:3018 start_codon:yes stop_codon:yes gene_type:complete
MNLAFLFSNSNCVFISILFIVLIVIVCTFFKNTKESFNDQKVCIKSSNFGGAVDYSSLGLTHNGGKDWMNHAFDMAGDDEEETDPAEWEDARKSDFISYWHDQSKCIYKGCTDPSATNTFNTTSIAKDTDYKEIEHAESKCNYPQKYCVQEIAAAQTSHPDGLELDTSDVKYYADFGPMDDVMMEATIATAKSAHDPEKCKYKGCIEPGYENTIESPPDNVENDQALCGNKVEDSNNCADGQLEYNGKCYQHHTTITSEGKNCSYLSNGSSRDKKKCDPDHGEAGREAGRYYKNNEGTKIFCELVDNNCSAVDHNHPQARCIDVGTCQEVIGSGGASESCPEKCYGCDQTPPKNNCSQVGEARCTEGRYVCNEGKVIDGQCPEADRVGCTWDGTNCVPSNDCEGVATGESQCHALLNDTECAQCPGARSEVTGLYDDDRGLGCGRLGEDRCTERYIKSSNGDEYIQCKWVSGACETDDENPCGGIPPPDTVESTNDSVEYCVDGQATTPETGKQLDTSDANYKTISELGNTEYVHDQSLCSYIDDPSIVSSNGPWCVEDQATTPTGKVLDTTDANYRTKNQYELHEYITGEEIPHSEDKCRYIDDPSIVSPTPQWTKGNDCVEWADAPRYTGDNTTSYYKPVCNNANKKVLTKDECQKAADSRGLQLGGYSPTDLENLMNNAPNKCHRPYGCFTDEGLLDYYFYNEDPKCNTTKLIADLVDAVDLDDLNTALSHANTYLTNFNTDTTDDDYIAVNAAKSTAEQEKNLLQSINTGTSDNNKTLTENIIYGSSLGVDTSILTNAADKAIEDLVKKYSATAPDDMIMETNVENCLNECNMLDNSGVWDHVSDKHNIPQSKTGFGTLNYCDYKCQNMKKYCCDKDSSGALGCEGGDNSNIYLSDKKICYKKTGSTNNDNGCKAINNNNCEFEYPFDVNKNERMSKRLVRNPNTVGAYAYVYGNYPIDDDFEEYEEEPRKVKEYCKPDEIMGQNKCINDSDIVTKMEYQQ